MKVSELMRFLAECDPDAQVVLAQQPRYPMEASLRGAVRRADIVEEDGCAMTASLPSGASPNDVLLCEGTHLRYGDRAAWEALP